MKYKTSVSVLIFSFLALALIILSLFFWLLFAGKLSKRSCGILLPSEGGYVEVWTEHLPQLARKINIPVVTIYTYKDYKELVSYLNQSDKYNILWAEVIVSGEYNLKNLLSEVHTVEMDKEIEYLYPLSLYKTIFGYADQSKPHFLPLSYNPWIMMQLKEPKQKTLFDISLGGAIDSSAYAFLTYVMFYNQSKKIISQSEAIEKISSMSNNKELIKNSRSYTFRDAFIALENETAKKTFLPLSFFNSLSISQRQSLILSEIAPTMICNATVAIFPVRKNDDAKERVKIAKDFLMLPDIMYSIANARGWMPAMSTTVSRSSYTEAIKQQAKKVPSCIIPDMQYSSKNEEEKLIQQLDIALRSFQY